MLIFVNLWGNITNIDVAIQRLILWTFEEFDSYIVLIQDSRLAISGLQK